MGRIVRLAVLLACVVSIVAGCSGEKEVTQQDASNFGALPSQKGGAK